MKKGIIPPIKAILSEDNPIRTLAALWGLTWTTTIEGDGKIAIGRRRRLVPKHTSVIGRFGPSGIVLQEHGLKAIAGVGSATITELVYHLRGVLEVRGFSVLLIPKTDPAYSCWGVDRDSLDSLIGHFSKAKRDADAYQKENFPSINVSFHGTSLLVRSLPREAGLDAIRKNRNIAAALGYSPERVEYLINGVKPAEDYLFNDGDVVSVQYVAHKKCGY